MKKLMRFSGILILLLAVTLSTQAQKKDLKPEDYSQWQRITTTQFSSNGNWFAYNISPVDEDGWLMLTATNSEQEHKFMHASSPTFSEDNEWLAFRIGVSEEEEEKLEEQDQQVKYKLGLLNLATAEVDTIPNIQTFEFSETGSHLAMRKYKPEGVETSGTDVLIRNLQNETDQLYGNVSDFSFNEEGTHLAMTIDASEQLGNGVHLLDLESNSIKVLESDTATFRNMNWNEEGTALTFLKSQEDENFEESTHLVYSFKNVTDSPQKMIYDHREDNNFPEEHRIVEYRIPQWSDDSETLFFGIKEWTKTESEDEEAESDTTQNNLNEDLDPSNVEVWHWQDDPIQPRQEVMANSERRSNHLSA